MILQLAMLISLFSFSIDAHTSEPGVCCVPVADLVAEPIATYRLNDNTKKAYEELPICWGKRDIDKKVCPRAHQLICNEWVKILDEQGDELLIELPNCFYQPKTDTAQMRNTFWTLKSNIISLKKLQGHGINIHAIPKPISFLDANSVIEDRDYVLALREPYTDSVTGKTYSAGTRFVVDQDHGHVRKFAVQIIDTNTMRLHTLKIPKKYFQPSQKNINNQDKRKNFVALMIEWAHQNPPIPLVYGGCSWIEQSKNQSFKEVARQNLDNETLYYWQREGSSTPYAGFDASNIILRAAQLCGIPYFCKNSITAALQLEACKEDEDIEEGDIIWIDGSLLVVSSLKNNKIITVMSYASGYGRVIELSLSSLFSGINSMDQLKNACINQIALQLLDKSGAPFRQVPFGKILKLKSVWN